MRQALLGRQLRRDVGSLIGTSTTTSYIESAAGVAAGGPHRHDRDVRRDVLPARAVLLAVAGMVPAYATAAALLYVACVMAQGLADMRWDDLTEYAPAVVTAVTMPLTYSIATGHRAWLHHLCAGQIMPAEFTEAKPAVVILALIFGAKFAITG